MSLPSQIDVSTPAGSAAASTIDNQIRDLKQSIVDLFSIPDATNVTNAIMDVAAGGLQTLYFQDTSGSPSAAGEVQRNGAELEFHDGTAARVIALQGQAIDLNGTELILDADGDTSLTADTDDQIDVRIANADDFRFTANTLTILDGSNVVFEATTQLLDMDGAKIDLDEDGDTSIHASTDDQIDIEISGSDDFTFTANSFNILSGSAITCLAGATGLNLDGKGVIQFDDDQDTRMFATTDDTLAFEISGATDFTMTANSFNVIGGSTINVLSGADLNINSGGTLTFANAAGGAPNLYRLYRDNIVKGWGTVTVTGGTATLADNYNITSVVDSSGVHTVTIDTNLPNTTYTVVAAAEDTSNGYVCTIGSKAVGTFTVTTRALDGSGTTTDNINFDFVILAGP